MTVNTLRVVGLDRDAGKLVKMTSLTRVVRIFVGRETVPAASIKGNSFASFPCPDRLGAWFEMAISLRGDPGSNNGCIATLADIDQAVRATAIRILWAALFVGADAASAQPAVLIHEVARGLEAALGRPIDMVQWSLTPFHQVMWRQDMPSQTTVTSTFEFAASHRMHDAALSEEVNRAQFGKCNWVNGHGHNYRVEVSVAADVTDPPSMAALEEEVCHHVIERFDHRNLNLDCPEFARQNASVENIATVCFALLENPLRRRGLTLRAVRVWETSKTSATVEVAPAPASYGETQRATQRNETVRA
jgi:6-pyruvoyltetrahydropterin/6-carboxytetrahydropterin synthase